MATTTIAVPLRTRLRIFVSAIFGCVWIVARWTFHAIFTRSRSGVAKKRNSVGRNTYDCAVGRHSFVKIDNVKLHYVEMGDAKSPPLLLLHGFPDCWLGWKSQLYFLSQQYRVFAVDLKGFGDSDKPGLRYQYRLPKLIEELRTLIVAITDDSKYSTVTLLAHDLGGLLGWFLLHDSPELVEKCVIVSSPHPNIFWQALQDKTTLNRSWMYSLQIPYIAEIEALKNNVQLVEKCCPHLISLPSSLEAYKYFFSRREDWTGPLNYYRNLIFWRIKEDVDVIDVPTLLIIGNDDPQISLESMVKSSEWCKSCVVKIVDGAGHFPHQEDPEKFNKLLSKFLMREKQNGNKNGKLDDNSNDLTEAAKGLVGRFFGNVNIFS